MTKEIPLTTNTAPTSTQGSGPLNEVLYEDPWVSVTTVPARRADGSLYPHRQVRSGPGAGAVIVPRTVHRGLSFLALVEQPRPASGLERSLEFPRGSTERRCESEAARELLEETGLTGAMASLGTIHPDTGLLTTTVDVWLASIPYDQAGQIQDLPEHESGARCAWVHESSVIASIKAGRITCGMTIAAYGLLRVSHLANAPLL